jgi:hypothetical protein
MKIMSSFHRVAVVACLIASAGLAQQKPEQKPEQKISHHSASATLQFTVVNEGSSKPVKNAEVILHPLDKEGRQKAEGLELKTHDDGKAEVEGVPFGKIRIQVIARGFRTYGEDYVIDQATHGITIKLQKPTDQYSIYK